ncbi:unnamed protein product [Schistosoma curassoni]|uniref:Uncharacterized protein n=1 Tax=Schistosoma curassoni TaxID=6186 RepID=A0A183L0W1_9TREM|nr:unnamed protein product [Schistosoma curassoni]
MFHKFHIIINSPLRIFDLLASRPQYQLFCKLNRQALPMAFQELWIHKDIHQN